MYDPNALYPGGTEPQPQYINRPAPTYSSGSTINQIEQRWNTIRATTTMIDQSVNDFLQIDVSRLIAIAKAAYQLRSASNAEAYRQAVETLNAVLK